MSYWLVKSDPDSYGWTEMARDRLTNWDGVRNPQARNYLNEMRMGDRALFYHSGAERAVVGVVEVTKMAFPDPGDAAGRALQVELKLVQPFATPVTLAWIKSQPALAELLLVRQSRLSVMPVDASSWAIICKAGGVKADGSG
jgi:predicted RNA-binding protein with PUA-like domain